MKTVKQLLKAYVMN